MFKVLKYLKDDEESTPRNVDEQSRTVANGDAIERCFQVAALGPVNIMRMKVTEQLVTAE